MNAALLTLLMLAMAAPAVAQQTTPAPAAALQPQVQSARVYKPNIADEDWSFLADRSLRQDFFDPIKYISLFGGKSYLTLGAEARVRPEGFRIRGSEETPSFTDNYVFQRYLFAAD